MTKTSHQLTGYRRGADLAFGYLATLFAVLGLVQVYLAGSGVFGHDFDSHVFMGRILSALALLVLLLALVARRTKLVVASAFVMTLLAAGATSALASSGWSHEWLGGLHALAGVAAVAIAGSLGSRVFKRSAWVAGNLAPLRFKYN